MIWEIFNNRELAGIFWVFILTILAASKKSIRSAFIDVIRAMLARPIISAIVAFSAYTVMMLVVLNQAGIWDFSNLKLTLIWFFPVIFASMFDAIKISNGERKIWSVVKGNLNVLILVEFVANFYVFNLLAELLIFPFAILLTAMQAISEGKDEHRAANKFATWLLVILGLIIFAFSVHAIVSDINKFARFSTVHDLLLPIVLSLSLAPFIAAFSAYAAYERVFVGLSVTVKDDKLRRYAKRKALFGFRFDTALLRRWTGNVARSRPETRADVDRTVSDIWTQVIREQRPPTVASEHGWSPYLSRTYLAPDGPICGDYFRVIDHLDEWCATSLYQQFGDGVLANSIAYYLNGNEHAATELKLVLHVEMPDEMGEAHSAFLSLCQRLYEKAIGKTLPDKVLVALGECEETTFEDGLCNIFVSREDWQSTRPGSFTLKFIIRHSAAGETVSF